MQGNIRQMFIKERPKAEIRSLIEQDADEVDPNFAHRTSARVVPLFDKFQILALIGTHHIRYCQLSAKGVLSHNDVAKEAPGRILHYQDDPFYKSGLLMLCDTVEDSDDYVERDGCTLNTFPLEPAEGVEVTLHSLKVG